MQIGGQQTCPVPEHPLLAEVAGALNQGGVWGQVFDHDYRLVYMTDDLRLSLGGLVEMVPVPLGAANFGPEYVDAMLAWPGGGWGIDALRGALSAIGHWVLADAPGGGRNCVSRWTHGSVTSSTGFPPQRSRWP